MDFRAIAVIAVMALLASGSAVAIVADDSEATSPIVITDGNGNTLTFDQPVNKIATIGRGPTSTVIELGYLDKIVVADKYSYSDSDPIFDEFKKRVDNGTILAHGGNWSTADLKTDLVLASDEMGFNKETDAIVIASTIKDEFIQELKDAGFKNILQWDYVDSYDDTVSYVSAISRLISGTDTEKVNEMRAVETRISEILAEHPEIEKRKAFYLTIFNGNYVVGNAGSLGTSMILAAGGDAYTVDAGITDKTYPANITDTYYNGGENTVIFVDSQIVTSAEKLQFVKDSVPGATLVAMGSLWNNYSIQCADGVWAMASAMYPEISEFDGEYTVIDNPEPTEPADYTLYIGIGVVAVIIIAVAVFLFMRK